MKIELNKEEVYEAIKEYCQQRHPDYKMGKVGVKMTGCSSGFWEQRINIEGAVVECEKKKVVNGC